MFRDFDLSWPPPHSFPVRALQPFRPQAGTVASQGLELDCSPIGGLRPETPSASWKASCKQFNMLDSQSLPDVPEALDANRPDLQQPESSVGLRRQQDHLHWILRGQHCGDGLGAPSSLGIELFRYKSRYASSKGPCIAGVF